jgi:sugar phosphate isomerase/epimerase
MTKTTRTGGFGIGFRQGWVEWQKNVPKLAAWAKRENFACLDLGADADKNTSDVLAAGLKLGSVDLPLWRELISPDAATRQQAVAKGKSFIEACHAVAGPLNYFVVMLPEKPALKRAENFAFMVESYAALAPTLEKTGSKIVIEGWPGDGALCCTPETIRAFFQKVPSLAMGLNFDPSHLIRMGIDPIRFLHEFVSRVHHIHGKDTEIFPEAVYEYGSEQESTFTPAHHFGSAFWRYTLPGHGEGRWTEYFHILQKAGYKGLVSVELEDENFCGTEESEKVALVASRDFLASC